MPDMTEPYAFIEAEATQMECKAGAAREEVSRLIAIAETCEEQARSLRWAISKQTQADEMMRPSTNTDA